MNAHSIEKDTVMPRMPRKAPPYATCPVEGALNLIDGKWKIVILYKLLQGTLRFNEIRRKLPNVTQRMLTHQLRQLEADGLVIRTVYPQVPPRVEYSLSTRGRSLEPVIMALKTWGDANLNLSSSRPEAA
jgi:DNA-binding HxlR family transcriptional regulator